MAEPTERERETEPEDLRAERARRRGSADVVLWGLALYAGCRAIELVLEAQTLAASVGQAVLTEWGSSRLGVHWTEPGKPATVGALARRAGIGAAVGLGLAALVVAVLAVSHAVVFDRLALGAEASILWLGFITAAMVAWRDELLLHGVVLRALDGTTASRLVRVLACGATSAGAALGRSDATPRTVAVAALLGVVFGALWTHDRGACQPWAASTALRFATTTLLSGGIVQARVGDDSWGGAASGLLGGTAAVVALAPVAIMAIVHASRIRSPRP